MTWMLAFGYALGAVLFTGGLILTYDSTVLRRLGVNPGRGGPDASIRKQGIPFRFSDLPIRVIKIGLPELTLERITQRLAAAGHDPAAVDGLLKTKVLLAAAGLLMGLTASGHESIPDLVLATVLAAAGFVLPDFRLARRAAGIRAAARERIPDLLDLMAVSVSAGLSPGLALRRAGDLISGPLGNEIARSRRDVELGMTWRDAVSGLAARTDLKELRRLAAAVDRSERLGSPLSDRLRELAREVRSERRFQAEERARRAPVAMLFPLVLLILPAFVLSAVVPAVLVAIRGID